MIAKSLQRFIKSISSFICFICIILLNQQAHSQDMEFEWAKQAGGWENEQGCGIAVDGTGNVFVTGVFKGPAWFGSIQLDCAGFSDIFITKIDNSGNFVWAKRAGGLDDDNVGGVIAVDGSGSVFVTGDFNGTAMFGSTTLTSTGGSDIFIAKIDASGNFIWAKRAGGSGQDFGYGVAVNGSGSVFVTGHFNGTAAFGSTTLTSAGSNDIFIAKMDASGNFIWAKQAGGSGQDSGAGIAVDGSGSVFVTGDFESTATFGSITLDCAGHSDIFIAKMDASGNFIWAERAGGLDNDDVGGGIAVDGSGSVFVTGDFEGTATFGSATLTSAGSNDIFIAKIDASGNFIWAKRAGGSGQDFGYGVAVNGSGSIFVTGNFYGTAMFGSTTLTSAGGPDVFVAKVDASGNFIWTKQAGGMNYDHGRGITIDGSDTVFMTGDFWGSAGFGSTTLTVMGLGDIFVTKMTPLPTMPVTDHISVLEITCFPPGPECPFCPIFDISIIRELINEIHRPSRIEVFYKGKSIATLGRINEVMQIEWNTKTPNKMIDNNQLRIQLKEDDFNLIRSGKNYGYELKIIDPKDRIIIQSRKMIINKVIMSRKKTK